MDLTPLLDDAFDYIDALPREKLQALGHLLDSLQTALDEGNAEFYDRLNEIQGH